MVEIRVGYELIYDCPQPTPMMLVLNIHYTRAADIRVQPIFSFRIIGPVCPHSRLSR